MSLTQVGDPNDMLNLSQDKAEGLEFIGEALPCSEGGPPQAWEQQLERYAGTNNVFMGKGTGAWIVGGRQVDDDFFFYTMQDNNRYELGSLIVSIQNNKGISTDLMVRAFGGEETYYEEYKGKEWEAASTKQRAAIVKLALIRNAKLAAMECGAKVSSLDDELATFETAFAAFDQRNP